MARWLAVSILVVALVFNLAGQKSAADRIENYYRQMIPEAASFTKVDAKVAKAVNNDGVTIGYAGIDKNMGYAGPVIVGTLMSPDGLVTRVALLEHKETPSYIADITAKGFFEQYAAKSVAESFELGHDLDGVSGATLSSAAIAKSVQSTTRVVAEKELKLAVGSESASFKFGLAEVAIALLFAAALFLAYRPRMIRYRLLFLALSAAVFGFWLNRPLTIAHVAGAFQGYFPEINTNLIWYIVVTGALLPPLITGRNVYCSWICPFCTLQEGANLISRKNLNIGDKMVVLRRFRDFLLFMALLLAFLFQNPSIPSYEPFATVFKLSGTGLAWYLLAAVLISSFFFRRFWCVAFCPVGNFLDKVSAVGRFVRKKGRVKGRKEKRSAEGALTELKLSEVAAAGSELDGVKLDGAELAEAELNEVEPGGAKLVGAKFVDVMNGLSDEGSPMIHEPGKDCDSDASSSRQDSVWSGRVLTVLYLSIFIGIMLVVFEKWWIMTP